MITNDILSNSEAKTFIFQENDNKTFTKLEANIDSEENQFNTLKEIDAGITEYLNDCKGFTAVLKHRFSDFQVHEIDWDGNIARLTNSKIPEVKDKSVDIEVISDEYWKKLDDLYNNKIETVEIEVTDLIKEKRKQIHEAVKHKYGSVFSSHTIDRGNNKIISISRKKHSNRSSLWFAELGNYLHFILFKKNLDTGNAINMIASYLKTKSSNLTYAGTKDKRANTTQWVSMWHLDAQRLNNINKSIQGLKVGNYIYKNFPLKLGDLKGNYFEIALRNVNEADEIIFESLTTVKENGFINYFGLQRFGNSVEIPTYEIGKTLIKGDFKGAVELILKPRKSKINNELKNAREIWWESRDASKAVKCFKSKNQSTEMQLLKGLNKHGKNAYVNALDFIPRNIRLLYLHAYQSLIWNKILSKRIKHFGKSILEGDLILINDEQKTESLNKKVNDNDDSAIKNKVRHINKEELQCFKITDIVHPLPGYRVTYPNNIIKQWYDECLKEDGLTFGDLKQTVRQYSLSGAYRHIVKKVNNMSWDICHYSDPDGDLILSDLDKLNGKSLEINQNVNNYKAVILKFSLDSSTYATMALREILKTDTSSYQATLNTNFNKRCSENNCREPNKKCKNNMTISEI